MYSINDISQETTLLLKKANYISIIDDNNIYSKELLINIYNYFSEQDKKIIILNYLTGEKEQLSSKYPILISDYEIESDIALGTKTLLYKRLLSFFKEKFPIEPTFSTLNLLIDDFLEEEAFKTLKKELTIHSDISLKFKFNEFTPNDLIKKMEINCIVGDEEKKFYDIPYLERLKFKLSLHTTLENSLNREFIYLFYYPERLLSTADIKELKRFLNNLIKNNGVVIVTTTSKHLLGDSLDEINIIQNKKLLNFQKSYELEKSYLMSYPEIKEWNFIGERLLYLVKNYLLENIHDIKITNKSKNDIDEIFLKSYEDIFILVFYLEKIGLNYKLDLDYNDSCVFSNYIKKNFYFKNY